MGNNNSNTHWQPDSKHPKCQECSTSFTFINRHHHCRNCGRNLCNRCTLKRANVCSENARLCNMCFNSIVNTHNYTVIYEPIGENKMEMSNVKIYFEIVQ